MHSFVIGCFAALLSSASFACGSVLWKKIGETISPESMNLCKGVLGCGYLLIALLWTGLDHIGLSTVFLLGLSGFIGITLGDTFFFRALVNLGPRLTSLFGTLTPGFISLAALAVLKESLSWQVWAGIALTITGIWWVLKEHLGASAPEINKPLGIKYCVLSVACTVIAILMARIALRSVSTIEATFIRLFWGTLGMFIWGAYSNSLGKWLTPFKDTVLFIKVAITVIIVTFGGFWLSLYALKYAPTGIVSTLNSTSAVFVLPMSAFWLKEKVTGRACLGAAIAIAGVALIFIGK